LFPAQKSNSILSEAIFNPNVVLKNVCFSSTAAIISKSMRKYYSHKPRGHEQFFRRKFNFLVFLRKNYDSKNAFVLTLFVKARYCFLTIKFYLGFKLYLCRRSILTQSQFHQKNVMQRPVLFYGDCSFISYSDKSCYGTAIKILIKLRKKYLNICHFLSVFK